jgi:Universal stress protein family
MAGSTAYVEIASATAILLDEAVLCLKARGTTVHGHVSLGRVVDCIAEHAAIVDADVIVLGYRQRSRLARWWDSGPTMDELLVRAGRTVMTVDSLTANARTFVIVDANCPLCWRTPHRGESVHGTTQPRGCVSTIRKSAKASHTCDRPSNAKR